MPFTPPAGYAQTAALSACRTMRFTLSCTWAPGPRLCAIGHNPAYADEQKRDQTMMRWVHFAHAWGFGGLDAGNMYPIYAVDPAAARDWYAAGGHSEALATNIEAICRIAKPAGMILAAWGAIATDPNYVESIIEEIGCARPGPVEIHCVGKTANGSPTHVMARGRNRVPDTARPVLWRTV